MPDHPVQIGQAIAGNGREHVVLDVEIHAPIQKGYHRIDRKGPTTSPRIGRVARQTAMLGIVAQPEQPAPAQSMEAHDQRHRPPPLRQRDGTDSKNDHRQSIATMQQPFADGRADREESTSRSTAP